MKVVRIFDFEFTCFSSYDEIAQEVTTFQFSKKNHKSPFLITPNVDDIVNWDKGEFQYLRREFEKSSFILPDGHPLVLYSKLVNRSLIKRTPGSSAFPKIWGEIKRKELKAFMILANEDLCNFYCNEYHFLDTYNPPFFSFNDSNEVNRIVKQCKDKIESFEPDFVFIGIQFPKQNILAVELFKTLTLKKMPLFLLLGASMEFYAGFTKRSPRFFQWIGMEWFYRFCQHPKRLFKRYFINDSKIIIIFIRELFKKKL